MVPYQEGDEKLGNHLPMLLRYFGLGLVGWVLIAYEMGRRFGCISWQKLLTMLEWSDNMNVDAMSYEIPDGGSEL